jgi:hypothetical protein
VDGRRAGARRGACAVGLIAKLIPINAESGDLIGALERKLTINGDILSTGVSWDAQP